jgi:hypothetical protein
MKPMKPNALLITTLLLVLVVVAIVVAWIMFGDRPGPMIPRSELERTTAAAPNVIR